MNLSPVLRQRYFDANGLPLAGGLLYSYAAGTSTPQGTYSNSTGTTNANPVVLDANGYADVWIDPSLAYKFILQDSGANVLWTVDNVSFPTGVSTWSINTVYSQGQLVADSSGQGLLYVSLTNANQGNALTSVANWRIFGGNVTSVSVNTALTVTHELVRSNSTSGALTHTLPACSTTAIGKKITIKDVGTGGFTTTVKGSGTDNVDGSNTYGTPLIANQSAVFENNGTSWDALGIMADKSVTQAKMAVRATGTTVAAGGVAISASCGNFSTSGVTFVDVTNLSVTITTTGRPVWVGLVSDGSGNQSRIMATTTINAGASATLQLLRGATNISEQEVEITTTASGVVDVHVPISSFQHVDPVAAGTYTYKVQANSANVSSSTLVQYGKLVAFEL